MEIMQKDCDIKGKIMKKIIIIANNVDGLIRFRGMLIERLKRSYKIICIVPDEGKINEIENLCDKVIKINLDRRGINPFKDFELLLKYFQIIKCENPDMVITYTIKPNVYGGLSCRLLNIPYVINITGLGTAFQNDNILKKIVIILYRLACKRAKIVFFENEENRQIFIDNKIVKNNKTYRLNGAGVDLDYFSLCKYPCKDNIVKFLFIGRIMKEKGINELLDATKKLINEKYSVELHVVGGFEEDYKDIFNKFEKEGWLKYHGLQNDVRPFINECHCFVLPSWHEGMANTNLECAATGRPVITSNIHGCLEAVEDGVTGFLCEKGNPDDLYRAMKSFVNLNYEERKAMGLLGRKRMEEIFDKKKVVEETMDKLF